MKPLVLLSLLAFPFSFRSPQVTTAPAPIKQEVPGELASPKPESYKIDVVHSTAIFAATHLRVSTFFGRFNHVGGSFIFDPGHPEKSQIQLKIRADSLDTNDPKRDRHAKGPDFLDSKQFRWIRFRSKTMKRVGGKDSKDFLVRGSLRMHGEKKEIEVSVKFIGAGKDPWGGYRCGFEAHARIKRSDFGMKFMIGPLSDTIRLSFGIEGIRQ
jgi:polyisoprenoid-binding protein YceI